MTRKIDITPLSRFFDPKTGQPTAQGLEFFKALLARIEALEP